MQIRVHEQLVGRDRAAEHRAGDDFSVVALGAAACWLHILHAGSCSSANMHAGVLQSYLQSHRALTTDNCLYRTLYALLRQVLGQAVNSAAGCFLTDESICKAVQAAFMLGDPVKKPKEYGGTHRNQARWGFKCTTGHPQRHLASLPRWHGSRFWFNLRVLSSCRHHGVLLEADVRRHDPDSLQKRCRAAVSSAGGGD